MSIPLADQINSVLIQMESGQISVETCIKETHERQPGISAYLFMDEHDFLTSSEKNQLLFMQAVFWTLHHPTEPFDEETILNLDEEFWEETEVKGFPFTATHPKIEAVDEDIFALIIDCVDPELHDLTEIGVEWLTVKGLVLACLLLRSGGNSKEIEG